MDRITPASETQEAAPLTPIVVDVFPTSTPGEPLRGMGGAPVKPLPIPLAWYDRALAAIGRRLVMALARSNNESGTL